MNNLSKLIEEIKSGVAQINFYDAGEKLGSGSGFLCRDKLITNNHVFYPNGNIFKEASVGIRFGDTPFESNDPILTNYEVLKSFINVGSTEDNLDYLVIDLDESLKNIQHIKIDKEFVNLDRRYKFELGSHLELKEGEQILIMGFPFGYKNLTSHIGYVSSIYDSGKANIIQLDASTNNGNSGGPVVDLKSKKAVGYVTRKQTGLAEQFDDLIKSFDSNLENLDKLKGTIRWGTLDLMDIFSATQRQMKNISINLKRSANTGIGFAFSCENLKKENFYAKP